MASEDVHTSTVKPVVQPQNSSGKKRDVYAIVGTVGGIPIVMGFLKPQVSQVLFKDRPNLRLVDHASGVYSMLEADGTFTKAWPNGTYLKVGVDTDLEDLAGADFDAKWKREDNTDIAPNVRLVVKDDAGVQKALINISPEGRATITLAENFELTVAGDATVAVTGSATVTVGEDLTASVSGDASLTIDGALTSSADSWAHTGPLDVDGTIHASGNVTSDATITAATDVVGGGKHLKTHTHGGVTTGLGTTGAPS